MTTASEQTPSESSADAAPPSPSPATEAARRVGESLVIALVTSTGLYLVGTVYVDAYYARLSIEPTALDLAPPFVALQAVHALPGLLVYPSYLLLWVLYRTVAVSARRLSGWVGGVRQRFPRLLLVLANLAAVAPLVVAAFVLSSGSTG